MGGNFLIKRVRGFQELDAQNGFDSPGFPDMLCAPLQKDFYLYGQAIGS
jgi:hypothetical protein